MSVISKDYPTSWGNVRASIMRVVGPSSYAAYTAPTTGGQDVQVSGAGGIKTVDFAIGGVSDSGLYRAEVVQIEASTLNGVSLGRTLIILKWYVVATGSEAGAIDLSAETVSVLVIGPK